MGRGRAVGAMAGGTAVTDRRRVQARLAARDPAVWTVAYLRWAALVDSICALAAGALAFELRFDDPHYRPLIYLLFMSPAVLMAPRQSAHTRLSRMPPKHFGLRGLVEINSGVSAGTIELA